MMKKVFFTVLRCAAVLAVLAWVGYRLWESGAFIFRQSATVYIESAELEGRTYSYISGDYTEGRTIAKGQDGWVIKEVKEDPGHTFIAVRDFLDNMLLVADDYTVPTEGRLTTVSWNGKYITDPAFLEAMEKIYRDKTISFTYETEGIEHLTKTQHMRSLSFAYENCPVATNYAGWMGKVNGEWVITVEKTWDTRGENGAPKPYKVSCYRIPAEYREILEAYFS